MNSLFRFFPPIIHRKKLFSKKFSVSIVGPPKIEQTLSVNFIQLKFSVIFFQNCSDVLFYKNLLYTITVVNKSFEIVIDYFRTQKIDFKSSTTILFKWLLVGNKPTLMLSFEPSTPAFLDQVLGERQKTDSRHANIFY